MAVLTQNTGKLFKNFVFKQNANFFRRKLAKIAEISDHNIVPRLRPKKKK
jgi:Zn/Cd-binding protein ZinT